MQGLYALLGAVLDRVFLDQYFLIVDLLTTKNVSIGPNLVTVIKFHTIVLYSVNEHFRWVGTFRISNYPILGQFHH